MTALFVKTFFCWLRDDSADFQRTRDRLDRDLHALETMARWVPGGRFGGEVDDATGDPSDGPDNAGADAPNGGDTGTARRG